MPIVHIGMSVPGMSVATALPILLDADYSTIAVGEKGQWYGLLDVSTVPGGTAQFRTKGGSPISLTAIQTHDGVSSQFIVGGIGLETFPISQTVLAELAYTVGGQTYTWDITRNVGVGGVTQLLEKAVVWWEPHAADRGRDMLGRWPLTTFQNAGHTGHDTGGGLRGNFGYLHFPGSGDNRVWRSHAGMGAPFEEFQGNFGVFANFRHTCTTTSQWQHLIGTTRYNGGKGWALTMRARDYMYGFINGPSGSNTGFRSSKTYKNVQDAWTAMYYDFRPVSGTSRIWADGFHSHAVDEEITLGVGAQVGGMQYANIILGNYQASGGYLFDGEVAQIAVFKEALTREEIMFLSNRGAGRPFNEAYAMSRDRSMALWMDIPTSSSLKFSVGMANEYREDAVTRSIIPKVYTQAGVLVQELPAMSIDKDIAWGKAEVTGLDPASDYEIRCFDEQSGVELSRAQAYFTTHPATHTTYDVAIFNCWDKQDEDARTMARIKNLCRKNKIAGVFCLGDPAYENPGTNAGERDIEVLRRDWDAIWDRQSLGGTGGSGWYRRGAGEAIGQITWRLTLSDHMSGPADNQGATNPVRDECNQIFRERAPYTDDLANTTGPAGIGVSTVIGKIRWIMPDMRFYRDTTGTPNVLFGSAQKTWIQSEVEAAAAAGQGVILLSECGPRHKNGDPYGDTQSMGNFPEDREWLWDLLYTNVPNACMMIFGDFHEISADNVNHTYSSLNGSWALPCVCAGPMTSSSRQLGSIQYPDWDADTNHYLLDDESYSRIEVTDNLDGTLDVRWSAHGAVGNYVTGSGFGSIKNDSAGSDPLDHTLTFTLPT